MRKLLLTLCAVILGMVGAFAQNPTLYLRGDANSWGTGNTKTGESSKFTEENGVYTLKLSSLTGAFKIADANWTASANFGGSGATTVSMDKDYTLISSASSGNLTPDANWTDVTLTFTLSTRVLRVTGQQKEQVITWGLKGNFTSSSWPTIDMKETSAGSGIWTASVTPTQADCKFGLVKLGDGAQIDWYTNTSATISETNTTVTLNAGEGDTNASLTANKTYNFTWNANTNQLSMTWENDITYPKTMYVIGNVNGGTWGSNNGFAMTPVPGQDGVFTATLPLSEDQGSGYSFFSFAVSLSDAWETMGARYGAPENDYEPSLTQPNAIGFVADQSFKVPYGTYSITIDLTNNTMTITKAEEEVAIPQNLYVIGTFPEGEWAMTNPTSMSNDGDGFFTIEGLEVAVAEGEGEQYGFVTFISQAGADWNAVNGFRYGPKTENSYANATVGGGEVEMYDFGKYANSYQLNPGVYTITTDFNEGLIVFEKTAELAAEEPAVPQLFVAYGTGTSNPINAAEGDVALTYNPATKKYEGELTNAFTGSENRSYVFYTGSASQPTYYGSAQTGMPTSVNLKTTNPTSYNLANSQRGFYVPSSFVPWGTAIDVPLTVSVTVDLEANKAEFKAPEINYTGGYYLWSYSPKSYQYSNLAQMEKGEDDTYTATVTINEVSSSSGTNSGQGLFLAISATDRNQNYIGVPATTEVKLAEGESRTLTLSKTVTTLYQVKVLNEGEYTVTFNASTLEFTVARLAEPEIPQLFVAMPKESGTNVPGVAAAGDAEIAYNPATKKYEGEVTIQIDTYVNRAFVFYTGTVEDPTYYGSNQTDMTLSLNFKNSISVNEPLVEGKAKGWYVTATNLPWNSPTTGEITLKVSVDLTGKTVEITAPEGNTPEAFYVWGYKPTGFQTVMLSKMEAGENGIYTATVEIDNITTSGGTLSGEGIYLSTSATSNTAGQIGAAAATDLIIEEGASQDVTMSKGSTTQVKVKELGTYDLTFNYNDLTLTFKRQGGDEPEPELTIRAAVYEGTGIGYREITISDTDPVLTYNEDTKTYDGQIELKVSNATGNAQYVKFYSGTADNYTYYGTKNGDFAGNVNLTFNAINDYSNQPFVTGTEIGSNGIGAWKATKIGTLAVGEAGTLNVSLNLETNEVKFTYVDNTQQPEPDLTIRAAVYEGTGIGYREITISDTDPVLTYNEDTKTYDGQIELKVSNATGNAQYVKFYSGTADNYTYYGTKNGDFAGNVNLTFNAINDYSNQPFVTGTEIGSSGIGAWKATKIGTLAVGEAGTLNVSLNLETNEVKFTYVDNTQQPEPAGEEIYVAFGLTSSTIAPSADDPVLTVASDGTYRGKFEVSTVAANGKTYFQLYKKDGDTYTYYGPMQASGVGTAVGMLNYSATKTEFTNDVIGENTVSSMVGYWWVYKLNGPTTADISVVFDLNKMSVTSYLGDAPEPGPGTEPEEEDGLYLGLGNGPMATPAITDQKLEETESGVYEGELVIGTQKAFNFQLRNGKDVTVYNVAVPFGNISWTSSDMMIWPDPNSEDYESQLATAVLSTTATGKIFMYSAANSENKYKVTVDLNNLTFTVARPDYVPEPEPELPTALWFFGSSKDNGSFDVKTPMTVSSVDSHVFEIEYDVPASDNGDDELGTGGFPFYFSAVDKVTADGTKLYNPSPENATLEFVEGGATTVKATWINGIGSACVDMTPGKTKFRFNVETLEFEAEYLDELTQPEPDLTIRAAVYEGTGIGYREITILDTDPVLTYNEDTKTYDGQIELQVSNATGNAQYVKFYSGTTGNYTYYGTKNGTYAGNVNLTFDAIGESSTQTFETGTAVGSDGIGAWKATKMGTLAVGEAGTLNVSLDLENSKVVFTYVDGTEGPKPEEPATLYLMGSSTGSTTNVRELMTQSEDDENVFEITYNVPVVADDDDTEYETIGFTFYFSDSNEVSASANNYSPQADDNVLQFVYDGPKTITSTWVKGLGANCVAYTPGLTKFRFNVETLKFEAEYLDEIKQPEPENPDAPKELRAAVYDGTGNGYKEEFTMLDTDPVLVYNPETNTYDGEIEVTVSATTGAAQYIKFYSGEEGDYYYYGPVTGTYAANVSMSFPAINTESEQEFAVGKTLGTSGIGAWKVTQLGDASEGTLKVSVDLENKIATFTYGEITERPTNEGKLFMMVAASNVADPKPDSNDQYLELNEATGVYEGTVTLTKNLGFKFYTRGETGIAAEQVIGPSKPPYTTNVNFVNWDTFTGACGWMTATTFNGEWAMILEAHTTTIQVKMVVDPENGTVEFTPIIPTDDVPSVMYIAGSTNGGQSFDYAWGKLEPSAENPFIFEGTFTAPKCGPWAAASESYPGYNDRLENNNGGFYFMLGVTDNGGGNKFGVNEATTSKFINFEEEKVYTAKLTAVQVASLCAVNPGEYSVSFDYSTRIITVVPAGYEVPETKTVTINIVGDDVTDPYKYVTATEMVEVDGDEVEKELPLTANELVYDYEDYAQLLFVAQDGYKVEIACDDTSINQGGDTYMAMSDDDGAMLGLLGVDNVSFTLTVSKVAEEGEFVLRAAVYEGTGIGYREITISDTDPVLTYNEDTKTYDGQIELKVSNLTGNAQYVKFYSGTADDYTYYGTKNGTFAGNVNLTFNAIGESSNQTFETGTELGSNGIGAWKATKIGTLAVGTAGTINVSLDLENSKVKFTYVDGNETPEPEDYYFMGSTNGASINVRQKMTQSTTDENVYEFTYDVPEVPADDDEELGSDGGFRFYFSNSDQVTGSDVVKYGPNNADETITFTNDNKQYKATWIKGSYMATDLTPGSTTFRFNVKTLEVEIVYNDEITEPEPTTIYVVGNGEGMTWDLPGQTYTGADGVITLNLKGVQSFKFSTNKSTEWDGDGSFNAGAYATGSVTFGDAVGNAGGQTLAIEPWGENQELPWTGDYTITIDLNKMTMTAYTATPKPQGAPDVYIRGDMNGWGTTWQMTYDEAAGEYFFEAAGATAIVAGQGFKFADANWGSINYGGSAITLTGDVTTVNLQKGGGNLTLNERFEGTIVFNLDNQTATFKKAGVVTIYVPEEFYLIGNIGESGVWDPANVIKMESAEKGVFYLENVSFTGAEGSTDAYFSFCTQQGTTGDWGTLGTRYGADEKDLPVAASETVAYNLTPQADANAFKIDAQVAAYDLLVTFDLETGAATLKVLEAGTVGILGIGADNSEVRYFTIDGIQVKNPENGIYIKVENGKATKVVIK